MVAPLAAGPLNVNADEAASALAIGLGAERMLFVTDVPGLLLGGAVTSAIDATDGAASCSTRTSSPGRDRAEAARRSGAAARLGVTAEIGETAVVA